MGKEQNRALNDFWRYFLGLPDQIAQIETAIEGHEKQIRGLVGLRHALDIDALSRGTLTGDPRLDAAICLSMFGAREDWISPSVQVYKAILEVEEKLENWNGGLVLYDATSDISPYCGEIILGKIFNPRLFVEFRNPGAGELERAVAVVVRTYEHIDYFNAGATVIAPGYTDEILDVTALFDPYWGGDTDLRYQANGPSAREGIAGLFLGSANIKRHLHDTRQRLGLRKDAAAVDFVGGIEQRFASLVTPDDPFA